MWRARETSTRCDFRKSKPSSISGSSSMGLPISEPVWSNLVAPNRSLKRSLVLRIVSSPIEKLSSVPTWLVSVRAPMPRPAPPAASSGTFASSAARGVPTEVEAPESRMARTGRPFSFTATWIISPRSPTMGVSSYEEAQ